MTRLVQWSGFIKSGNAGGYMRYIATRTGVEKVKGTAPPTVKQKELIDQLLMDFPDVKDAFEYEDYQKNPTVQSASEFITTAIDINMHNLQPSDTYMNYIATRPRVEKRGDHGLFCAETHTSLPNALAQVNAHQGNVWTIIYSLRREDAARLGYDSAGAWQELIRAHSPELADAMRIPQDKFQWYGAFHNEGHHPHIHMMIWSDDPSKGFLTKSGITQMRSALTNSIFEEELHELYVRKDVSYKEVTSAAQQALRELLSQMSLRMLDNPIIADKMEELVQALNVTPGKKQYGYLPKPLKTLVDEIVNEVEKQSDVADAYEKWFHVREELCGFYNTYAVDKKPLSEQKEFRRIKNIVISEAESIRLGRYTFEDEEMDDDPEPPEAKTLQGREYRQAKQIILQPESSLENRVDALKKLEALYENGYIVAGHFLGKLYRDGERVQYDQDLAKQWFYRSASAGNNLSQYAYAKIILETDPAEAFKWLQQSAKQGNPHAQYRLGKMFLNGDKVDKDIAQALNYLEDAARQGNQYAQYTLGKLYLKGEGVKKDLEAAHHWFEQSAAQGNQYAQFFLDRMYSCHDPSILIAATRLLHHMSRIFRDNSVMPGNPAGIRIDSKRRQELMEQRYAAGHSLDDHEDPENNKYQQTM